MQIKDIMTTNVEVVSPDTTLKEAAVKMKNLDTGALPVCDGTNLVGMITDRDIAIRSTAQGQDPKSAKVKDAMTQGVIWCIEDQSIEDVVERMEKQQIRRIPVISRDKRLVGIVSLGDIVSKGSRELACDALEKISEHAYARR